MSSSFIKFKEEGFWSDDSDTQVFCGFLFYTYSLNIPKYVLLKDFINHIKLVSLGYYNSYIHFDFEQFFENKNTLDCYKLLLHDTKCQIASNNNEIIDLSFLNKVIYDEYNYNIWNFSILKQELLELNRKFYELITLLA